MIISVKVGAPAHGGHCIARHEGRAVFVRHALPGEQVRARVVDPQPEARFWMADTVEVLEASPDRVVHPWAQAAAGAIGGAELGHVALAAQREWKRQVLVEAFSRFAALDYAGTVAAAPGDDERGGLRYRTRVSAVADADGRASMAPAGGGERVRLESMPLAVDDAEEALLAARAQPGERIEIAVDSSGRVAIGSGKSSRSTALTERVRAGGVEARYRVRLNDFWQVHTEAPNLLVGRVLDLLGDAERVVDLYAGVGLFAVAAAQAGRQVTAVELAKPGAESSLEHNLAALPGADALLGDVRQVLSRMVREETDLRGASVVLDPPRTGAKAATIAALAALEPARIVYVACDPVALARDAALLAGHGYRLVSAEAWDLFPMTHHFESIAAFVRE